MHGRQQAESGIGPHRLETALRVPEAVAEDEVQDAVVRARDELGECHGDVLWYARARVAFSLQLVTSELAGRER